MGNECKEVCVSQRWLNFSIVLKIMASSKDFAVKLVFYYHILLKIGFDPNAIYR